MVEELKKPPPPKEEDEVPGVPEWMCTFGDMMSLLLTFFIMLFSMSVMETEKSAMVIESMREQFGHDMGPQIPVPGPSLPVNSMAGTPRSMGRAKLFDLKNGGDKVKAPTGDHPRVQAVRAGAVSTSGKVAFTPSSATLTEQDKQDLDAIFTQVKGLPQVVEIRAHTSSRPIENPAYRDKLDLCYMRARIVLEYLVKLGLDPKRVRLSLAGSNEPQHISTSGYDSSPEDRVEVMLMSESARDLKGTPDERREMYSPEGLQ